METPNLPAIRALRPPWNKGRIVGQKRPLKPKHVWAIRVRLELAANHRDLALFNLAIDSKLRGCDLVKMKVVDVMASGQIKERASVLQSKTQKPCKVDERSIDGRVRVPLAGSFSRAFAHLNPPICPHCARLGFVDWIGSDCLRHPLYAAYESHTDLQEDWQLARCSTAVGTYQNGQHSALSRC